MLRTILVAVDLTPASDRVLARVALLPLEPGARIVLLHVVPDTVPPLPRVAAVRDAQSALDQEAGALAGELPGVTIETVVAVGRPAMEVARCATEIGADLVAVGRGAVKPVRDVFLGSTAERVVRHSLVPVLAVRLRARRRYSRPAIALDFDDASSEALAMLLRMLPPPRPSVAVVHAYDAPYQLLVYPSLSEEAANAGRASYRTEAVRALTKLFNAALGRLKVPPDAAPHCKMHIASGGPRQVIRKAVEKVDADLLVLGTHAHSGLAQAFLGTVAGDVLREVSCDVLVVPPRAPASEDGSGDESA